MKALIAASACALASANSEMPNMSPTFKDKVQTSQAVEKVKVNGDTVSPQTKLSGYLYEIEFEQASTGNAAGQQVGVAVNIVADMFAKIQSPAFWLSRNNDDWLVMNPHVTGELTFETAITLKLWLLDVTFIAKVVGYKFAPVDLQLAWDLNEPNRYCYSVGLFQEVFDVTLEVETLVNECIYGILGLAITDQDTSDCVWRRYQPHLPIWGGGLLSHFDRVRDYVPWTCSDGSELSTWDTRVDSDGDGQIDEHFHGWEPSNVEQDGDDVEEEN